MARRAFRLYLGDPDRPSYLQENGINVWYWIGTHNDYESFIGRK